jgi:ATP-dependent exoDNAse (exonuclease V) beta subunit
MMTVHRAKGLEFPIVILADPTSRLGSSPERHVDVKKGLAAPRIFGCAPWELVENEALEADREAAEGVRIGYVAATRARDMLILPIVGDDPWFPEDGWLAPLVGAIAPLLSATPEREGFAKEFGTDSVLERPPGETGGRKTITPGVHHTPLGEAIVWDPATLNLGRPPPPSVRGAEDLIAPRESEVDEDRARLSAFIEERAVHVGVLKQPSASVVTATQAAHAEEEEASVSTKQRVVEKIVFPRSPTRPGGARFGDLVHQTLATIELSATAADIARVVGALGRIVGATEEEMRAAESASVEVTRHALWGHFIAAEERGELRREVPLAAKHAGGIVEGIVDVAYKEDGVWTVVDFKTDAPELGSRTLSAYEKQVRVYAEVIETATGCPARASLLFL